MDIYNFFYCVSFVGLMIGSLLENELHDRGEVCTLLTSFISRTCHSGYWPTGFSLSERQAQGETEDGRKVPCDLTFLPGGAGGGGMSRGLRLQPWVSQKLIV